MFLLMLYNNIIFRDVGNTELFPHHNKYGDVVGGIVSGIGSLFGGAASAAATRAAAKARC